MSWDATPSVMSGFATSLSDISNVDTVYQTSGNFTNWIILNPYEQCHLQVGVGFGATGNDLWFRTTTTLNASSPVPDTLAFNAGTIAFSASSIQYRSIVITGPYCFRVEVRKGGATAGGYSPSASFLMNGVSA